MTRLATTRSTCKARLVTHSAHLATLSTRSTRLSTCSTRFSTRSTRLSIHLSIRSARLSTCSTRLSARHIPKNTPHGFQVETMWKWSFPRRFNQRGIDVVCL